jgi:hypothetical protein
VILKTVPILTFIRASVHLPRPGQWVLAAALLALGSRGLAQPFTLVGPQTEATIWVPPQEPACVQLAAQDLASDVAKITGRLLRIVSSLANCRGNCVVVGSQTTPAIRQLTRKAWPKAVPFLAGQWEAYVVQAAGNQLLISGSDERGTMFGLYHFVEQYLGVDPLYFWSGLPPPSRPTLAWDQVAIWQAAPTFRFRGWFINDEDLLTDWMDSGKKRDIDYPFYGKVVAPEAMRHVVEALVRLRYNLLIPASFVDIRQPAEAALVNEASRRGLFVSMHHVEPMGVSAFSYFNYWKERGKKPLFSFFSNRAELEEVWRVYAAEWAKYPNVIWQIGLRGIADRPMWMADPNTPQIDADRGKLISEAMQWQVDLIGQMSQGKKTWITTTLWAEGSTMHQAGHLKLPEGVITVFSDNSPGWRMQQDFRDTPRVPGKQYGIYYHHQLWGSGPHLAQGVPPAQTHRVLAQAVQKGDTTYAIMNVSNVREFQVGVGTSAKMLYNFGPTQPQTLLADWAKARFAHPEAVKQAYQAYFDAFLLDEARQVPFLLDGQIRMFCLDMLADLKLQLTDPAAYAKRKAEKAKLAEDDLFWSSIGDMAPKPRTLALLLAAVAQQRAKHLEAQRLGYLALALASPTEADLLRANLLAHTEFMLGLASCLEHLGLATVAAESGQRAQVGKHLAQAQAALAQVQAAKKLATVSERWAHWYRGDQKLNVARLAQQVSEVAELAR